jgi:flagellar motor switch protein FliG
MRLSKSGSDAYKKTIRQNVSPSPNAQATPENSRVKIEDSLHKKDEQPRKSGARRSAELLLMMGQEAAAEALKHMSAKEIEAVIHEISILKTLNIKEASQTLDSLGQLGDYQGGVDVARGFLKVAFGDEESERILQVVANEQEGKPFDFLDDTPIEQIITLLKSEPIETLAVILPRIKPQVAKQVLENVPIYDQGDLIRRIATMSTVNNEVIIRMDQVLRDRLRKQDAQEVADELDGTQALAEILRHMDAGDEKRLITELAELEPATAEMIERQMVTIDILFLMNPRDLNEILRLKSDNELAILLKGKTQELRKCFLSALTKRRAEAVLQEEKYLGPMLKRDVERATRAFLDDLRERERKGQLLLMRPGESFL